MADKSLDEIIASKGLNFKVKFQNQDAQKKLQGKVFQQGGQGRQGFPSNKSRAPGLQKKPFSAPVQQQKQGMVGPKTQANGGSLAGPGKGQIDARDMITIKNRIKIPDARAKIMQKRLQKGNFDARSKLKPKPAPGIPNQPGMVSEAQPPPFQQVKMFQQPQQPGQQAFQQRPGFPNQPPQFQQPPPQFQQPPPQFQQPSQRFQQPPPRFQQPPPRFQQQNPRFQQPPSQFQPSDQQFQQPPAEFEELPLQFEEPSLQFPESAEFEEAVEFEEPFELQEPVDLEQEFQFQDPQEEEFLQSQSDFQQQPPPNFQQPPPLFQQPRPPFPQNQPPPFQQNRPPLQRPPPPMFQQRFQQPSPRFQQQQQQQPFPRFQQPPPTRMQQPLAPQNRGDMIDNPKTSVTFSTNRGSGPGSAPTLTRTLMNPLASGGALVEDTGSSLKITRSIPDVTFDGSSLTVTRRLPPNQEPSQFRGSGQRVNMDSQKGPVIQIHNEKFRAQPVMPPGSSSSNRPSSNPGARLGQQVVSTRPQLKVATRSPIQPPTRTPVQSPAQSSAKAPQRASVQSAPPTSSFSASGGSRYKYTNPAVSVRTETSLESQGRLKPAPGLTEPSRRPAQSALSRIQLQAQTDTFQVRSMSPKQPAMKRLAPAAPYSSAESNISSLQKAGVKRKAPVSLSDRFSSGGGGGGGGGNPIPVITDQAVKKRRTPAPEPVEPLEEEYVEDFELKEQFEEEDPAPALLSPLQGFCILVSNLHSSVTQDDIIELFGAIGPLKRANLLQRGQAEVAFIHREHAVIALKKYHNRELDGQPMFVKLVTPINAKVMKTPASAEETVPALPPSLRTTKKSDDSTPIEIPLIHKALFKTGSPTPGKSVRFTVKI